MTTTRKQMKIAIADLKISKLNMRHERKKPVIIDILPSIEANGIYQPLLVRREGDHWGVVAGRRRFWCLKALEGKTGRPMHAPCIILKAGDDAAALEASLMENIGHLPSTEMQQYEAFGRLAAQGRAVCDIAHQFGITELMVRRVLALAGLAPEIRKLYAQDDIARDTAKALTLATPDQQSEWLRLYHSSSERAPEGRQCKAWLGGGAQISAKHVLFDIADYDGVILEDLFAEEAVFGDAPTFWKAQSAALAARVETYIKAGWHDVQVLERGEYFHQYDHVRRARTKGGKVFISVAHNGEVTFYEGYISEKEARKLDQPGKATGNHSAPIRPEMSGPMADYILQHRRGAACAQLLKSPAVALRLAVAHMVVGSAHWSVNAPRPRKQPPETQASLKASIAAKAMHDEGKAIDSLFAKYGFNSRDGIARGSDIALCEVFAALFKMTDTDVMRVQAYIMAKTLECGSASVEAVLHVTATDLGEYWTPDDAFFHHLRDKRVINAMVASIAGPATAKAHLTDTGKVQKEIITNRINGNGVKSAQSHWRPGWMQVPPSGLVKNAPCRAADDWRSIGQIFAKQAPESRPTICAKAETIAA